MGLNNGLRGADEETVPTEPGAGRNWFQTMDRGGEMMERDDAFARTESDPALEEAPVSAPADEEPIADPGLGRVGCRTDLRGWAGALAGPAGSRCTVRSGGVCHGLSVT